MNFKITSLVFCLFIISRILFVNYQPVFFDSVEYLSRFENANLLQAISSGHSPFHPGYVIPFWLIFNFFKIFHLNPSFFMILCQIIFSVFAIFCLYYYLKLIFDKNTSLITALLFSLTPIYWITNVVIMADSTYVNFFFISLFFIGKYLTEKKYKNVYLIFGCLSYVSSLLTNPLVILWSPIFLFTTYLLKSHHKKNVIFFLATSIIIAIFVNSTIISFAYKTSLLRAMSNYLFGVDIDLTPSITSIISMFRFIRNFVVSMQQNNTCILIILLIVSILKTFKNKKIIYFSGCFILPILITSQWYDSLLYGRHSMIASVGICLLAANIIKKIKVLLFLTVAYVFICSFSTLYLLKTPIPGLQMRNFVEKLPKGLIIESHFFRPQIENHYSGKIIYINQPGWNKNSLKKIIDDYLKNDLPIFITAQALSEPYGLYLGPYLHPLSLSYTKSFELNNFISQYKLKKYMDIDKNSNLMVYKIIASTENQEYPRIKTLKYNRRRIDYFDPLIQLYFLIDKASNIQNHNIING